MHILETGRVKGGPNSQIRGNIFRGIGIEERGVEYSISLSLVKSRNWPMPLSRTFCVGYIDLSRDI